MMNLGRVLRRWRLMEELDLRTVAQQIGTNASTLLRIEQGKLPNTRTLRAILLWLLAENNKPHPKKEHSL